MGSDVTARENILAPEFPGIWMLGRQYLWQMGLLTANELASKTGFFKLGLQFSGEDVAKLWQLGLLRADLVRATRRIRKAGLVHRGQDEDGYLLYSDERTVRVRRDGIVGALARIGDLHEDIVPLFHPFRYYVLSHLQSSFTSSASPMIPLRGKRQYRWMYEFNLKLLKQWSSAAQYGHDLDRLNDIAALAISLEPCFFQRLFGQLSVPFHLSVPADDGGATEVFGDDVFKVMQTQISDHWDHVALHIQVLGVTQLERIRSDLCVDAERLSPNKEINVLMRLQRGPGRLETEGTLGGAIYLHTMAEMLRRAAEKQFDTILPEEDELGFGWSPPGLKRQRYGADAC